MVDSSLWFWPVMGALCVLVWAISENGDMLKDWWSTEIVADYPFEDDL